MWAATSLTQDGDEPSFTGVAVHIPDSTAREPIIRPLNLDAGLAGTVGEPHYAIVDIGSNSVRMVVYDQMGRAPLPRYVEKSLCRLGEGLAQTEAISEEGFRRTPKPAPVPRSRRRHGR